MTVSRQYQVLLQNKLNQLTYQGYVIFERWELLAWYGRDRITNVIWRDIDDLWQTSIDGEPSPLRVIKCDDSKITQKYLVFNSGAAKQIDEMT